MDISMPDTLRRELDPLVRTAKHSGTRENLIVTIGTERWFAPDGVVVHAVPARRWLLSCSHGAGPPGLAVNPPAALGVGNPEARIGRTRSWSPLAATAISKSRQVLQIQLSRAKTVEYNGGEFTPF